MWLHMRAGDLSCYGFFLVFFYCRLNDDARHRISDLGSSVIKTLGFRDNWIFVGGKGIRTKSPFEQVTRPAESMFIPLSGTRAKVLKESLVCQEMSCILASEFICLCWRHAGLASLNKEKSSRGQNSRCPPETLCLKLYTLCL